MIKLITDSGTNFPKEYLESHPEIEVLQLPTMLDGEDISNMGIEEFYRVGFSSDKLPKTSQISPQKYVECFSKYKDYDAILYISLASGLSGTYNSACLARNILSEEENIPDIYIFDSETACVKQSVLVDLAYEMIMAEKPIKDILKELKEALDKIVFYAVIENLDFLCKGGRLSKTSATAAGVLGVRPIITVDDGKVKVLQKIRGSKKTIGFLTENIHAEAKNMFVICGAESKDFDSFKKALTVPYVEERIQKTIGTYTGPNCYGYAYIRK